MAVAVSNLSKTGSFTTASSYVTGSMSLVAGRLYLLTIRHVRSTAAAATTPTVTGASQTWAQVHTWQNSSNTRRRSTVFLCQPSSDASGALTIDFAAQTQNQCDWVLDEFTGVPVDGSNGSTLIVQSTGGDSGAGSVTSFSLTLSAFGSPLNATYAVMFFEPVTVTKEAGYTETENQASASAAFTHQCQFLGSPDTSPSWTSTSGLVYAAEAMEIKAAVITAQGSIIG